ncbi:urokinase plasminogen activator surface receptor-like [Solea solea]|uniref:urokinase plasminogen activator surface receptor-like n=1 Tax=Solea solea TaxID=90069 RepID=UPI00272C4D18|nr:urokinase plasminogen activator surface receptor-like [Solea solea]
MLLLLIFGTLLLPKAIALKCYECLPGLTTCTDTPKDCPSSTHCAAMRVIAYAGSSKISDINMKTCALAEQCVEGSINFGVSKTVLSTKCCTSELCNKQPLPDPPKKNPNGKKCYRCDGKTCTGTLNCEGNEDYCVSSEVDVAGNKMTLKGCASKSLCSSEASAQIAEGIGSKLNCCQGNYCNSAGAAGAGLVILVAPLMSLVLFA